MKISRIASLLLLALLGGLASAGCQNVHILPRKRVVLNGREFYFRHIESLRPVAEPFTEFVYEDGEFFIKSRHGAVRVNGMEIATESRGARVANRSVALKADERLYFSTDMSWDVVPGASISPPPMPEARPVPASFKIEDDGEATEDAGADAEKAEP